MVLALVEHDAGEPTDTSLQALTLARAVAEAEGEPLAAVAVGDEGAGVAEAVGAFGVDELHHVTHQELTAYAPAAWASSLGQLVDDRDPAAVIAPGTDRGQEVLAHLAARRDLALAANCTAVDVDDAYEVTRERWGGNLIEHARLSGDPKLLSTAPHSVAAEPADASVETAVEAFEPKLSETDLRVVLVEHEESDVEGVPLGQARVVVGGGRGVGGPEDFDQLEVLADLLGGTVGSSRAAVNEGWRPHDDQIGLTGTKITPDIYIACGISGAVQHMVGCKGSDTILAINNDPEAAIIQKCDYAVVGDLHEVVPALNDRLTAER
jgi:electron transfer flavoprotein alpha subunit